MFHPVQISSENVREKIKIFETNSDSTLAIGDSLELLTDCIATEESDDDNMMPPLQQPPAGVSTDSNGLIVPKKLINPCMESGDRKNLHRELLFNQKVGKSVLNQKTELQKALEKQKERQLINTQQQIQNKEQCLSGELGRVIMQRAQRLEGLQKETNKDDINNQLNPEYLNARAKLRATIDSK